ncbi:MAG TPA: M48 family metallopeptidase [Chitinophagaceae bacterium]|nr:M48 family metallopeptidase [Chitinophagaceae bacterium]
MKNIPVILATLMITSCNYISTSEEDTKLTGKERNLPANMVYSYECLKADSGAIPEAWEKADNILGKVVTFNITVTDQEQMDFGEQFMKEGIQNKNLNIDSTHTINATLDTILANLLRKRVRPTGITYKIYLLNDTATINAYTVGGKIFITKAMIKKCTSNDQLYAIIGHEVGHNEKGHIKNGIKQMKASKKFFGEWGDLFFMAKKLLTGSFNQKNELEADYFGLDLTWKLGYDVCAIRTFWDDMAKEEEHDKMLDFLRTHPYSDIRSRCLVNHIRSNFKVDCN